MVHGLEVPVIRSSLPILRNWRIDLSRPHYVQDEALVG